MIFAPGRHSLAACGAPGVERGRSHFSIAGKLAPPAQKINNQLEHHIIWINDKEMIACILRNKDDNMKVQVVTASASALVTNRLLKKSVVLASRT
jgi:hypothetical protein